MTGFETGVAAAAHSLRVALLVPFYNEQQVLPEFYATVAQVFAQLPPEYSPHILFVDDGSSDSSLSIVKNIMAGDPRVGVVSLSRNFGKERALLAGFDHVDADAVIVLDADLQDPPALIPEMLRLWREGYQDVYARRRSRAGETLLKRVTSSLYYRVLQRVTRIEIQRDTGDFRLLDRACVTALKQFRESERNTKALFSWIGFRKTAILYDRNARQAGKSKFNYLRLLNLAIDGITSFTVAPLRASAIFGLIVSAVAFFYLIFIVVRAIFVGSEVAGYPSLMAVMLFIGGVQLLSLGVIGEYVGRIFHETKRRPPYLLAFVQEPHTASFTSEPAPATGAIPIIPAAPQPAQRSQPVSPGRPGAKPATGSGGADVRGTRLGGEKSLDSVNPFAADSNVSDAGSA